MFQKLDSSRTAHRLIIFSNFELSINIKMIDL